MFQERNNMAQPNQSLPANPDLSGADPLGGNKEEIYEQSHISIFAL
jgi:hypothetical protein